MLAGCPGWLGAGVPRLAWQDKVLPPSSCASRASSTAQVLPPLSACFCSQPVAVCSSLSRSSCPHTRSCSGLSRDGMVPRPVRGSWSWWLKVCSSWAPLEEGSATHSQCARCSVRPPSPGLTLLFLIAGLFYFFFLLFFKCLFVQVELARVGVSGYGPLHSPQTWRKLRESRASCLWWPMDITHCCFSAFGAQLR